MSPIYTLKIINNVITRQNKNLTCIQRTLAAPVGANITDPHPQLHGPADLVVLSSVYMSRLSAFADSRNLVSVVTCLGDNLSLWINVCYCWMELSWSCCFIEYSSCSHLSNKQRSPVDSFQRGCGAWRDNVDNARARVITLDQQNMHICL